MSLTAAELRVGITADTSRLGPGLARGDSQVRAAGAKSAQAFGQSFGSGLSRGDGQIKAAGARSAGVFRQAFAFGIGTIGAQLATGALVRGISFITDGISKLRDEGRLVSQTNAVIRSTGGVAGVTAGQVDSLADSIKNLTGIQDEEVRQGANLLLTFTSIRNAAGAGNDIFNQATKSATDLSVALGQDMKSSAIQLGKALNDPVRGITALRRVGVSFTKDQETQIKNLVKHNDLLGAQRLVLAEINKEFGGSAAAFGASDAGKAAKLGNAIEDAQKAIAKGLLPGVTSFQENVTKTLTNPATVKALTEFGKTLGETLGAIPWGSIAQGLSIIAGALRTAVQALNTLPGPLKSGALALLIGSRLPIVGGPLRGAVGGLLGLPGQLIGGLLGRLRGGKGGALGAIGGAVGEAASGATPVHVTNWPAGIGAGGLAGDALGLAGGGGKGGGPIARFLSRIPILGTLMSGGGVLAAILPFVPAIAAASIAVALAGQLGDTINKIKEQGSSNESKAVGFGQSATLAQLIAARNGVQQRRNELAGAGFGINGLLDLGGGIRSTDNVLATLDAAIARRQKLDAAQSASKAAVSGRDPLAVTLRSFLTEFRRQSRSSGPSDLRQAQNTVNAVLKHSGAGGSLQTLPGILASLQKDRAKALKAGDTVSVKGFDRLIEAVKARESSVTKNRQAEVDRIVTGIRSFIRGVTGQDFDSGRTKASQRAHSGASDPTPKAVTTEGNRNRAQTRATGTATIAAVKSTDTRAINRAGFGGVQARVQATTAAVRGVESAVRTSLRVTVTPSPVTITLDGRAIGTSQIKYEAARNPTSIRSGRAVPA